MGLNQQSHLRCGKSWIWTSILTTDAKIISYDLPHLRWEFWFKPMIYRIWGENAGSNPWSTASEVRMLVQTHDLTHLRWEYWIKPMIYSIWGENGGSNPWSTASEVRCGKSWVWTSILTSDAEVKGLNQDSPLRDGRSWVWTRILT
jgi:hypothetical protein